MIDFSPVSPQPHPVHVVMQKMHEQGWDPPKFERESGLKFSDLTVRLVVDSDIADHLTWAFPETDIRYWLELQSSYNSWRMWEDLISQHTIAAAMIREELTEEEAYFILRFAGRLGYQKAIRKLQNPFRLTRRWLIWIGGWESPELSQWDRGSPAWELRWEIHGKRKWRDPTPVSLFGHSVTFYDRWMEFRWPWGGHVIISFPNNASWERRKIYWSPDGTPSHPRAKAIWGKVNPRC